MIFFFFKFFFNHYDSDNIDSLATIFLILPRAPQAD